MLLAFLTDAHACLLSARPAAGPTAEVVKRAKQEIKRILEESTEKAMRREGPSVGRYSVM